MGVGKYCGLDVQQMLGLLAKEHEMVSLSYSRQSDEWGLVLKEGPQSEAKVSKCSSFFSLLGKASEPFREKWRAEGKVLREKLDAVEEQTDTRFAATRVVHWPSGPVPCCDRHAVALCGLGQLMGGHVVSTTAPPGAQCQNCVVEHQAEACAES